MGEAKRGKIIQAARDKAYGLELLPKLRAELSKLEAQASTASADEGWYWHTVDDITRLKEDIAYWEKKIAE